MKIYLQDNVLEASKKRVSYLFDEFDKVVVNFSGGKDSEVVLDLAIKEAGKRGKLPVTAIFIDQEAEFSQTIDRMRELKKDKRVNLLWFQMPIRIFNATSYIGDNELWCWKDGEEWLREKEKDSIHKNLFNEVKFVKLFEKIFNYYWKDKKLAVLYGIRAEENLKRALGMTSRLCYKNITWGRKYKNPNHFAFGVIYDWSYTDVWKYIFENNIKYNKIYDLQYQYGLKPNEMRVSNLHHETSIKSLTYLPEVDIELYNKLVKRLKGINSYLHFYYYKLTLPYMFKDWIEYRDYLLEKLIPEEKRTIFIKWFKRIEKDYKDVLTKKEWVSVYRSECDAIVRRDFDDSAILNNLYRALDQKTWKRKLKN